MVQGDTASAGASGFPLGGCCGRQRESRIPGERLSRRSCDVCLPVPTDVGLWRAHLWQSRRFWTLQLDCAAWRLFQKRAYEVRRSLLVGLGSAILKSVLVAGEADKLPRSRWRRGKLRISTKKS